MFDYKDPEGSSNNNNIRKIGATEPDFDDAKEAKEILEEELELLKTRFPIIGCCFWSPEYPELCLKLADVASKLDLLDYASEELDNVLNNLIDGVGCDYEIARDSSIAAICSIVQHSDSQYCCFFVENGILPFLKRISDEKKGEEVYISDEPMCNIVSIYASLAHVSRKMCNFILNGKFTIEECKEWLMKTESDEMRKSCIKFFASTTRFPLSDNEIRCILEAFNVVIENDASIVFDDISYAIMQVCGRPGNTAELLNSYDTLNKLIAISPFSPITMLNMLNGVSKAAMNKKVAFGFEIDVILDQLENEETCIASAAAHCITCLVQSRKEFLQSFNIDTFVNSLIDLFYGKSKFNSKFYVAEAISMLMEFVTGYSQVEFIDKGSLEILTFLMQKYLKQSQPDFIGIRRTLDVVSGIFESAKIKSSTQLNKAIMTFDDNDGFQIIVDIFDDYSDYPMVKNKETKEKLNMFMENYAPDQYRPDEED